MLVKVNGDIITKTELEQRQVAALRQRMQGQQIDPESLKNDETLKKALAGAHAADHRRTPIDELLLLQRGKELGLKLGDDQFKAVVANIRKEQGLTDDAKFQRGPRAGRHDDGRPAEAAGAPDADRAGAAPGGRIEAVDHRRRGAAVLREASRRSSPTRRP